MSKIEKPAVPRYFAVPDPLDPGQMSYWYRPVSGRKAGQVVPWPSRSSWSALRRIPAAFDETVAPGPYRAYVRSHHVAVGVALGQVDVLVERGPVGAAARFAALTGRCCRCGRKIRRADERGVSCGVDAAHRTDMSAEILGLLIDAVRAAHGEYARAQEVHQ
ncbi:hypothetical protein [Frankia sp. Cj3]|uniref:hypothetical protein n=1 Tax=Frankia sp. Cj3 TaxID=2880976 RepID=UPI001EF63541|nr:hypothetical protein [Frankia sp. Cj3]